MNRGQQGFTEKDWKLFRSKIAGWQENYMERLNQEYMDLLGEGGSPSDKFWKLEERIREDKKKVGVQADMRRSMLIYNLLALLNEGAISFADLTDFSDELQETIQLFMRGRT